jgi:hypothetical protein
MDIDLLGIKISGDATGYDKSLKDSEKTTKQSMDAMSSATDKSTKDMAKGTDSAGKQMKGSMDSAAKGTEESAGKAGKAGNTMSGMLVKAFEAGGKAAGNLASTAASAFSSLASGAMAAGKVVLGAFDWLTGGVLTKALSYLSFDKLWSSFRQGIDDAVELDKQARRVGASVLDLRAGALWAGVSTLTFAGALSTTNTKLSELRAGNVLTSREFDNLAALSGKSAESIGKGWTGVYDAISAIQDPTQRAAAAFRFLGGNASEFLDRIAAGGAGASISMAKRLGLELTPGDIASMQQVQKFLREIDAVQAGVFNQILAGFAPLVAEITTLFDGVKVDLEFIKPLVIDVAEAVGLFGAGVVEVVTNTGLLKEVWLGLSYGAEALGTTFKMAMINAIADILSALSPLKAAFGDLGQSLREEAEGLGKIRDVQLKGSGQAFSKAIGGAQESNIMKETKDFFGRVRERATSPGPTREKENADFNRKLVDSFRTLTEGLKTPLDNWKQGLMDFKTYTTAGFFKGREEERGLAALKMIDTLRQGTGLQATPQFAAAATSDTKEAVSAAIQYSALGQRGTPEEQIRQLTEIANAQREAQKAEGKRAADALEKILEEMEDQGEIEL